MIDGFPLVHIHISFAICTGQLRRYICLGWNFCHQLFLLSDAFSGRCCPRHEFTRYLGGRCNRFHFGLRTHSVNDRTILEPLPSKFGWCFSLLLQLWNETLSLLFALLCLRYGFELGYDVRRLALLIGQKALHLVSSFVQHCHRCYLVLKVRMRASVGVFFLKVNVVFVPVEIATKCADLLI